MLFNNTRSLDKKIPSYFIQTLIILAPATYVLNLALNSGEIPSNDYWGILLQIYSIDGFSYQFADWLQSQNGHILLIPKVIYALNIILTRGANVSLSLVAWLFALVQAFLFIQLLPRNIQDRRVVTVLIFSISAVSFIPSATDNWIHGFSGVHWIGANMLVIASIACLTYHFRNGHIAWIFGSLLFAIAATFTYGTAFALWPALCVGTLLVLSRLRLSLLYVGITILVYTGYLSRYGSQSGQSTLLYDKISPLAHYIITYLGAIFTTNNILAPLIGTIGILLSVLITIHLLLRGNTETRLYLLPWFLIQLYTVGNAFITGLSRSHLGTEQAMASRYASLPGLYWISLIVIVMYYLSQTISKWSWYKLTPAFAVIGILIMAMYPVGFAREKEYLHQLSLQPLAILSIDLGIPDDVAIKHAITPAPVQFLTIIPTLKAHKHIPFDKQHNSCGQIDQIIPQALLTQTPQSNYVGGYFNFMDSFSERGARVIGWAYSENRDIKCIALLNEKNTIRGFAFSGFYRPDIAETLNIPDQNSGWMGYARVTSTDEMLTAYVLLTGDEHWVALDDTHSFERAGQMDFTKYSAMFFPPP